VWFNEAMRRVVDDKERQLDILRMRESSLAEQCQRHQETIRQLTDNRGSGAQGYKFVILMQMSQCRGSTGFTVCSHYAHTLNF
jgi:hypothetical protein